MGKRIDLEAVRAARRNLETIAAEHPELLGESSAEEWAEALEEVEKMTKTIQVGVRFPPEVLGLIDRFAEETTVKLRESLPGLEINRAGAIRILVEKALRDDGYDVPDVPSKKRKSKPRSK